MLTRLRINGFKSLLDAEIFFGPFTCFIGQNAAGKSNIFDAIRFMSLLAELPIMEAASQLRESSGRSPHLRNLFTLFGSFIAPEIRLQADLIIDRKVEDDFGQTSEASKSTVRYEVAFKLDEADGASRLELIHESLVPITKEHADESVGFVYTNAFANSCLSGRQRTTPYISASQENDATTISLHQEDRRGRLRKHVAQRAGRTVLSAQRTSEFPTVLAVRKEMLSWQSLMLEPSAMRAPSYYRDPDRLDQRGAYLPSVVHRLQRVEVSKGSISAELTNKLAELVEDVQDIRVVDDPKTETLTLEAKDSSGIYHPARSLSDGTLRFLTLAVLSMDPMAQGVLCLEEPENGIHPDRVQAMVTLLRDIAVDPMLPVGEDNPLRQVVVNTHSGTVMQYCELQDVIQVSSIHALRQGASGRVTVTEALPNTWRSNRPHQLDLALGHLRPYFASPETATTEQEQLWLELLQVAR